MHALSMNTVLPCNTYHNKSSVNKMILKIINVKQYRRGSKKDIPDKLYQHRLHTRYSPRNLFSGAAMMNGKMTRRTRRYFILKLKMK